MIVFLSFPNRDAKYRRVVSVLRERGLTVLTNFDGTGREGPTEKADQHLARIRKCTAFVFFSSDAPRNSWSPLRQIEFGYALGREKSVAFVGKTFSSLHNYGDVFDDVDDFLRWWYSDEYYNAMDRWYSYREGASAVA
ncbi:MAG TPA: hypothetical protein VGR71_04475 [Nitrospira sp.]|nr:hypothetical protein [Nitrospira sp.]